MPVAPGIHGVDGRRRGRVLDGPWLGRAVGAVAAAQAGNADLVVFNAKVYTVDSRMPRAEAFAVKGGRFIAVGRTTRSRAVGKEHADLRRQGR